MSDFSRTLAGSRREKGRGATQNPASRFLARHSEEIDDGWNCDDGHSEEGSKQATELLPDRTVKLITTNQSPDIPFDRSINPYKGCEHGCVYCFARPTHAYLDLSPGLDFERKIFFKTNVRERLTQELTRKNYECATIAMGTNTDPYQPAEKDKKVMREILETLLEWRHPLSIVTKSALILRDKELLIELARLQLVTVHVSVTTLDVELKTRLEPRTAGPSARLKVIRELSDAGVPVGVMVAPVIPFINDSEIEDIVRISAASGALACRYILLRLPGEVAPLFQSWLEVHYPLKTERVLNTVRDTRGGKLYDATWGRRMRGQGVCAELIADRFASALRRAGLENAAMPQLRTDLFEPPGFQASLF